MPEELIEAWRKDRLDYLMQWDIAYARYQRSEGDVLIPHPQGYGDIATEGELLTLWRLGCLIWPPRTKPNA